MSVTISNVLKALEALGLTNVMVEENGGEISFATGLQLDDDGSTLVPFEDDFDDDPE
jgi:hypothetical protein